MRALRHHGARKVSVDTVLYPDILEKDDIILRVVVPLTLGEGLLNPETLITHRMTLEEAAEGYKLFDEKQEDCRKVILTP